VLDALWWKNCQHTRVHAACDWQPQHSSCPSAKHDLAVPYADSHMFSMFSEIDCACRRFAYTHREANLWLDELLQLADACSSSSSSSRPLVVGVDTETAVVWGQGQRGTPTSLLQLCYHAAGTPKVCLACQHLHQKQCANPMLAVWCLLYAFRKLVAFACMWAFTEHSVLLSAPAAT
jgi:hypothetical protein